MKHGPMVTCALCGARRREGSALVRRATESAAFDVLPYGATEGRAAATIAEGEPICTSHRAGWVNYVTKDRYEKFRVYSAIRANRLRQEAPVA